ncbi:MAG: sigma-54 interaction domain-containing protein [Carboxydocellales bacterium]
MRKRLQEAEILMDNYRTELVELQKERIKSDTVVTCSDLMEEILDLAERLAQVNSTVLITGESGVGKSVIASFIHKHSPRQKGPFVTINCGAIPENLMESELFGYESGAFTGAKKEGKKGLLEIAHSGSMLRVGGQQVINVDIRIIAATNKNLEEMVKKGTFREDLFYRLNVVPMRIPPLRERREDVVLLLGHFLGKYDERYDLNKRMSPETMEILMEYPWPGNVRELENLVERMVVTTDGTVIYPQNLPDYIRGVQELTREKVLVKQLCTLKEGTEALERQLLKRAYYKYANTYKVAELLGVNQSTVVRKLKKYSK